MEEVINTAGRVAKSKATVLIRGESGTGKELVAKAIHYSSERQDKPLITINCAALSENLLESELFGHEKGSFTGAVNQRIGRFEQADGGTLFIDEIGDIPLQTQVKLLRALQFGDFERVGGSQTMRTDVRVITATNRGLEKMIDQGFFREDLFYRINVVTVLLPPLRLRKTDIPVLVQHFLDKYTVQNDKKIEGLDPTNFTDSFSEKVAAFETEMIEKALELKHGNQSRAAELLGISERHLRSRMQKLGIINKKRLAES